MDFATSGLRGGGRCGAIFSLGCLGLLLGGLACERRSASPANQPVALTAGEEVAEGKGNLGARRWERGVIGPSASATPPPSAPEAMSPRMSARPAARAAKPKRGLHGLKSVHDDPLQGLLGAGSSPGVVGMGQLAGAPAPAAPRLDPNARYATTYRPGGAALAAFDAALARGSLPVAYRDLVGDFAARYAPALAAPDPGALVVAVDTDRAAIAPAGGPLHLRVALRSATAVPPRAQLSVHLVLDVSGSMEGKAITNARAAAESLVNRLDAGDEFSMIVFSSDAQVLVPVGKIGPRRAAVLGRIRGVGADGGTNISAGLDLAYQQAGKRARDTDAVNIVMVLSDGQANAGDTNPASLAQRSATAFQDGIQTSAFGLGDSFDAALMATLADRGAGGYYYLADSTQIAPALARELDARLQPAALAVEVRVRLRPEITPTKVYGSRQLSEVEAMHVRAQEVSADVQAGRRERIARDRQDDAAGGMRFFMPSFARDDQHSILLALQLPAGVGDRPIGTVELRYKDRLLRKNVTRELAIRVRRAPSEAASAATVNASVQRTVQAFAAGDAILAAAERVDAGDRAAAARLLDERAQLLARASKLLGEPLFVDDGKRLARLAAAVGGVSEALPLAILLRGSGYGYLQ